MSTSNQPKVVRVFVSYSHDSNEHRARVIDLAQRLREDGVDCRIDAFVNGHPPEGWPLWMEREFREADFVLLVCSEVYHRRFRVDEISEKGLGVIWESNLTREHIYAAQGKIRKIVPILFEGAVKKDIPALLRGRCNHYYLKEQYASLLRHLTDQPMVVPMPIGPKKDLPVSTHWPTEEIDAGDKFATSIRNRMSALHRHVEKLTQDQYRVIRQLRGLRQVRVSGCAGSGKTLVAAEKAIRLSDAGISTLFLCHNPLLAEHIAGLTQGSGVRVTPFGDWIAALAEKRTWHSSGLWTNYEEPSVEFIERAFDAVLTDGPRYDAIIVDEGQDFRDEWWAIVEASLSDPRTGILYVFHDDHQALLPYRACYPIDQPVFDLSRNCRNAGRIYGLMQRIHPAAPMPEKELKELGDALWLPYKRGTELTMIERAVNWVFKEGFGESFVVLLGGSTSFEDSPFSEKSVSVSNVTHWQREVRRQFERVIRLYDKRGIMVPPGGTKEISTRLARLSTESFPTPRDVELVCEIARSFKVHPGIRDRIPGHPQFRNAMTWTLRKSQLQLWRPSRASLWAAEVILHFARKDWYEGIPKPRAVCFQRHYSTSDKNAVPV